MKKLAIHLLLGVLALPLTWLVGCCPTVTLDADDRNHIIARNIDLEARQFVEDWDYFWLIDEPSKLTPWYMPNREP